MKVFFMGTAEFAVPALRALLNAGIEVAVVITQPDRPRGRGHKIQPSALKEAALELGLSVWQPEKIGDTAQLEKLRVLNCDAGCVVAYGQILPQALLKMPLFGCLNVHASLLPRWRGAAPVHWAVAAGDTETGVCVQKMALRLDSGDVLLSSKVSVEKKETDSLLIELAPLGAKLLVRALEGLKAGKLKAQPQEESAVTYAPLLKKEDGQLDFTRDSKEIVRLGRAFSRQPGCRTQLLPQGLALRVYGFTQVVGSGKPGSLLQTGKGGWVVACGKGALKIAEVQAAGKKRMTTLDFERGHILSGDAALGSLEIK